MLFRAAAIAALCGGLLFLANGREDLAAVLGFVTIMFAGAAWMDGRQR